MPTVGHAGRSAGRTIIESGLIQPDDTTHTVRARALRRRHAMLALEFPAMLEFDDPALEWRRLFSELLGTFLLVMVGAGGAVVDAVGHGAISRAAAVTAPGLMVMAIILFMGAVSGAHLNPAVTMAFTLRGDFPWRRVPGYVLVQFVGATLACVFLRVVFGDVGMLGATEPGARVHDWQAMLIELVLTAGLVSTILGTASRAQNVGQFSALAVGGYIILAGLWSSPVSGAAMNPARSFAPESRDRGLRALLGLRHRAVRRGVDRRRCRVAPARARRRQRRAGRRPRHARPRRSRRRTGVGAPRSPPAELIGLPMAARCLVCDHRSHRRRARHRAGSGPENQMAGRRRAARLQLRGGLSVAQARRGDGPQGDQAAAQGHGHHAARQRHPARGRPGRRPA